ncbi:transposase [Roseococcus sp. YIM B11640]|uniref:transposase n=1 Tax=Roseococcus sp. YIM B11640 TaxID=3133973 RepID=UPI003C7DA4DB
MPYSNLAAYSPLSDPQWAALSRHLPKPTTGRPCDLRARLNAIFHIAATNDPWHALPPEHGSPATIARYFRTLTHAGLWERLLKALAAAPPGDPLRELQHIICRATRRAIRLRGLPLVALIRRLGLLRALPAPPRLCPDPALSSRVFAMPIPRAVPSSARGMRAVLDYLKSLRKLIGIAGGRQRIPRAVRAAWI